VHSVARNEWHDDRFVPNPQTVGPVKIEQDGRAQRGVVRAFLGNRPLAVSDSFHSCRGGPNGAALRAPATSCGQRGRHDGSAWGVEAPGSLEAAFLIGKTGLALRLRRTNLSMQ